MKLYLIRAWAVVLVLLGALSVFSGGSVLLGINKPHYSPYPLIIYYTSMGLAEIFISLQIWKKQATVPTGAFVILAGHISVLVILLTVFAGSAIQNIIGMGMRAGLWTLTVLFLYKRKG